MPTAYQFGWACRIAFGHRPATVRNPFAPGDPDRARWASGWRDACQYLTAKRVSASRFMAAV